MPIYALAISARSILGSTNSYVSQVAVTVAPTKFAAEVEGLYIVKKNFPVSFGYSAHACAAMEISQKMILAEVPQSWVLARAAELLGVDFTEFIEQKGES